MKGGSGVCLDAVSACCVLGGCFSAWAHCADALSAGVAPDLPLLVLRSGLVQVVLFGLLGATVERQHAQSSCAPCAVQRCRLGGVGGVWRRRVLVVIGGGSGPCRPGRWRVNLQGVGCSRHVGRRVASLHALRRAAPSSVVKGGWRGHVADIVNGVVPCPAFLATRWGVCGGDHWWLCCWRLPPTCLECETLFPPRAPVHALAPLTMCHVLCVWVWRAAGVRTIHAGGHTRRSCGTHARQVSWPGDGVVGGCTGPVSLPSLCCLCCCLCPGRRVLAHLSSLRLRSPDAWGVQVADTQPHTTRL